MPYSTSKSTNRSASDSNVGNATTRKTTTRATGGVSNDAEPIINAVGVTNDTLTGRGGLALFVRYLRRIEIGSPLQQMFGSMRRSRKGVEAPELFKQLFCFFLDGTSHRLSYFDTLKPDEGYAAAIESRPAKMASSHTVKRFFRAFGWPRIWLFRWLLQQLFVWRLQIQQPDLIELGIDTMVMDNDMAQKRHGVQPTYKKVKGFQPLQMTWGRFIVDAVFRGGSKHSNHGDTVEKMVRHVVELIRTKYRQDVAIVLRSDSGFFDQKLFEAFEKLGIGYVCGGKLYDDIKRYVAAVDAAQWRSYENAQQTWSYIELGDRRGSWDRFRRAIYCRPQYEDRQRLLEFARPDTVIYTNLGRGGAIDAQLRKHGRTDLFSAEAIIRLCHGRGRDELVHRALKDFGMETLPFKRFAANAAFYYTMLLAFFLYEAFKEDVCASVVPVSAYATTLRRKLIDIAAKIVRHADRVVLKVTEAVWTRLQLDELFQQNGLPPPPVWA